MNFQRLDLAVEALNRLDEDLAQDRLQDLSEAGKRRATAGNRQAKSAAQNVASVSRDAILAESLMAALRANEPDFVKLYLDYGAKVHKLQPSASNLQQHDQMIKSHRVIGSSDEFPGDMLKRLEELPPCAVAVEQLYYERACTPNNNIKALVRGRGYLRDYNVVAMEKLLRKKMVTGTSFHILREWKVFNGNKSAMQECEAVANHMLFVSIKLMVVFPSEKSRDNNKSLFAAC